MKGDWQTLIHEADFWGLTVDDRHHDLATLLQNVVGGDGREEIEAFLLNAHGVLPSDRIDLAKLEALLRKSAKELPRSSEVASSNDERDKFLYEQDQAKVPFKRMIAALREQPDWELITSIAGIKRAITRYVKRKGLPPPAPRAKRTNGANKR